MKTFIKLLQVRQFKKANLLTMMLIVMAGYSCKKMVDVDPPTNKVTGESVFASDATAASVLTGLYIKLSSNNPASASIQLPTISFLSGLSSDELTLWSGASDARRKAYYTNNLVANSTVSYGGEFWLWSPIFTCNSVVEALSNDTKLTPTIRQQLLGEAKFMRAFYYFYLVNLYGEVPLEVTTDYKVNSLLPRASISDVYNQIITDLKDAKGQLSSNYLSADLINTTDERVRPTQWAAAALLARVYLYTKDYVKAEEQSSLVINNKNLFDTTSINKVFLKNSKEAIWQLQPVNAGWNTEFSKLFILPATGPNNTSNPAYLSSQLLNAFEPKDYRRVKGNWVDSINVSNTPYLFSYKYKSKSLNAQVTEYLMVLRIAEQYLIRAEARAQQDNISGSQADLNIIRTRAGLPNTTSNDKSSLLAAVEHERQVELFTEWGDRWFNLKRTGAINSVMNAVSTLKGGVWNQFKALYPLPYREPQVNLNINQNDGY